MGFPKDFIWGAAAASYQIEGAAYEDGKGLSVWDMLCREPGHIWEGNNGDVACDHYHRYEEDAQIMNDIGLKAYRLSVCWPRVIPEGTGAVNEKGLDFYDRLIDALLAKGVEPWVTLFHWDYPHELFCRGGWLNRRSSDWFADYARVICDKLSDRVSHWMTLNEPQCFIALGHQTENHAPGLKLGLAEVLLAAHNSLLAHGKAVQVLRANAKKVPVIGAAPVGVVKVPASETEADIDTARKMMFSVTATDRMFNNTWWADPVVLGQYPEDGLQLYGKAVPKIHAGDMETMCQPLDFYGANIYQGTVVRSAEDGEGAPAPDPDGPALTTMTWRVVPKALYWGPKFLHERYKLPVVITENGMANCDWIHVDGKVHDPQRIDFLTRYLRELGRAVDDGIPVKGYFQWSIMDNFEWAYGYRQRFGLVYVDYETQKRIPKDSAHWYRDVIASNGENLKG